MSVRPGDWSCPSCNYNVFASKSRCRCGTMKPGLEDLPQGVRPGDWTCPSCNDNVFASKRNCRCGFPKPGAPPYTGSGSTDVRPGDWNCANCDANVFASKSSCFKCGTKRDSA